MTGSLDDRLLDQWLSFAHELADAAHELLAPAAALRPQVQVKADRSFVTALTIAPQPRLAAKEHPWKDRFTAAPGASWSSASALWSVCRSGSPSTSR
jgi:hypothetical protein